MHIRNGRIGSRRRGTVAVLSAACFTGILFLTALAIDDGQLMACSRQAQNYCDAAAIAGCIKLASMQANGQTPTSDAITTAATLCNTENNFSGMGTSTSMKVNWPPTYSSPGNSAVPAICSNVIPNLTATPKTYLSDSNSVEVYLTFTRSNMIVGGSNSVTVRSVASCAASAAPYIPMLVTDPSGADAFHVNGGSLALNTAPVQVNSNNANAAVVEGIGASAVTATVKAVGGTSGSFTPAAKTGGAPVADPLALVPEPSTSGLTKYTTSQYNPDSHGNITLNPGYYPNGLYVINGGNVTMNPGLYYIEGGNFWINTTGTVSGTGVTVFHNGSNSSALLKSDYNLDVGICLCPTNGNYTISPPTTGTYAGISFYQGQNCTQEAFYDFWGSGRLTVGTQYFSNSTLRAWSVSNGLITCNELICKDFSLKGTHEMYGNTQNGGFSKITWTASRNSYRPTTGVVLVE
jgi:Putative Flp pilus-assembly TadE/G-like